MRILTKSDKGEYQEQFVTKDALHDILKEAADDEGNITRDVVLFQDCRFKALEDGSIAWTLSDYTLDRDMERIDPNGWNLKEYKANPIVLWSHDVFTPAIGKMTSIKVKDGKLIGHVKFSSREVDPFAAMIEGKVLEGILSGGSVGFKSNKIEIVDDKKDRTGLIHREQTLYEFSIVNMPANPAAVAQRGTAPDDVKQLKLRVAWLEKILMADEKPSYITDLFKDKADEPSLPSGGEPSDLNQLFPDAVKLSKTHEEELNEWLTR